MHKEIYTYLSKNVLGDRTGVHEQLYKKKDFTPLRSTSCYYPYNYLNNPIQMSSQYMSHFTYSRHSRLQSLTWAITLKHESTIGAL